MSSISQQDMAEALKMLQALKGSNMTEDSGLHGSNGVSNTQETPVPEPITQEQPTEPKKPVYEETEGVEEAFENANNGMYMSRTATDANGRTTTAWQWTDEDEINRGSENDNSETTTEASRYQKPIEMHTNTATNFSSGMNRGSQTATQMPLSPPKDIDESLSQEEFNREQTRIISEQNKLIMEQRRELEEMRKTLMDLTNYRQTPEFQQIYTEKKNKIFNTKQDFEDENFSNRDYGCTEVKATEKLRVLFKKKETAEESAQNYKAFIDAFTEDVEKRYGGWTNISSLKVSSEILYLNNSKYTMEVDEETLSQLNWDLRNNIKHGYYAWIFNYAALKKMKNLGTLEFDSADFVYSKVRGDLGIIFDFSPASLFGVCKSLRTLKIGGETITSVDKDGYPDIFKKQSRVSEKMEWLGSYTDKWRKFQWDNVKSAYNNPETSGVRKFFGTLGAVALAVPLTAPDAARRVGGFGGKLFKGAANFANSLRKNLK